MVDWKAILESGKADKVICAGITKKALRTRNLIDDADHVTRAGDAYIKMCDMFKSFSSAIIWYEGKETGVYVTKVDREFVQYDGNRVQYERVVRGQGLHRID
jgi:hypothetical protein